MTRHVVNYSGGEASWYAAELVAEEYGTADLTLLFADVFVEAPDLYRFLIESAAHVFRVDQPEEVARLAAKALALPPLSETAARKAALRELASEATNLIPGLVWIAEGRTPWEVFRDVRFVGNSRIDPCSRVLKRDFLDAYVGAHFDRADTVQHFGLDANEEHRLIALWARRNPERAFLLCLSRVLVGAGLPLLAAEFLGAVERQPEWRVSAPLIDHDIYKEFIRGEAEKAGLRRPDMYDDGFPHANCGGACVKAGQGNWLITLKRRPEVYAYAESEEQACFEHIGPTALGVLCDRAGGGPRRRMSLRAFRERAEAGAQVDLYDLGGCGCAV